MIRYGIFLNLVPESQSISQEMHTSFLDCGLEEHSYPKSKEKVYRLYTRVDEKSSSLHIIHVPHAVER